MSLVDRIEHVRSRISRISSLVFPESLSDVDSLAEALHGARHCSGGVWLHFSLDDPYNVHVEASSSDSEEEEEGCQRFDSGLSASFHVLGSLAPIIPIIQARGVSDIPGNLQSTADALTGIMIARMAQMAVRRRDAGALLRALSRVNDYRFGVVVGGVRGVVKLHHKHLRDYESDGVSARLRSGNRAFLVDGDEEAYSLYSLFGYWVVAATVHRDVARMLRIPESVDDVDVAFALCTVDRGRYYFCAVVYSDGGVIAVDNTDSPFLHARLQAQSTFGLVQFLRGVPDDASVALRFEAIEREDELLEAFRGYLRSGDTSAIRDMYVEMAKKYVA